MSKDQSLNTKSKNSKSTSGESSKSTSGESSKSTSGESSKSTSGESKSGATSNSASDSKQTKSDNQGNENNSGKKAVNPPRPASFFSSVRSDEYRSGWDSVFGKPREGATRDQRFEFSLSQEDLSVGERKVLLKAFRRKALSQGMSVDKWAKSTKAEWHLTFRFKT